MKFSLLILFFGFAIVLFQSCENQIGEQENIDAFPSEVKEIENNLANRIHLDSISQTYSIVERMKEYKVPGLSITVVSDGKIRWSKGYGIANSEIQSLINHETLFQAASISKPITALAILKLYEEGKIDLDEDVNIYLKRWKISDNEFTQDQKVTIRRLLTHTAGVSVHGFPGYASNEVLPELEAVLNGEGNTNPIVVNQIPGQNWRYSGGGYTILQLLIEDVSGQPFTAYIKENILLPIGMNRSTFSHAIDTISNNNISAAFNSDGEMIMGLWHNYPELAAAGLWTTPSDLAKYCIEIQEILDGKENGVLEKSTVEMMLTNDGNDWGLGPSLSWDGDTLRFGHGGKNAGFTNRFTAFAYRGNAVIIMTNGDNGNQIINELERSVSNYYNWGINNYKIVRPIETSINSKLKLIGNYKYTEGDESIIVGISLQNDTLFFIDTTFEINTPLIPVSELDFVSQIDQLEISFKLDNLGFIKKLILNNQWEHFKVKKELSTTKNKRH
jgi:CubicO group peptidase (beta-lactamase class C family)